MIFRRKALLYHMMTFPAAAYHSRRHASLVAKCCTTLPNFLITHHIYRNLLYVCTFLLILWTFSPTLLHIFIDSNQSNGIPRVSSVVPFFDITHDQDLHDPTKNLRGYRDRKLAERQSIPLIFVGGMPRSGTTLMRAILDAHPGVSCGEETRVIPRLLFMRKNWSISKIESNRLQEARITDDVLDSAVGEFILAILTERNLDDPNDGDHNDDDYNDPVTNLHLDEVKEEPIKGVEPTLIDNNNLDERNIAEFNDVQLVNNNLEGSEGIELGARHDSDLNSRYIEILPPRTGGAPENDRGAKADFVSIADSIKKRRKAIMEVRENEIRKPTDTIRLCNKDPFVMKTADVVGRIFPRAKFVFMIRDGRAVVQSVVSRKVTITGWNVRDYKQSLKMWNNGISQMYDICQSLGPSRCMPVHYEALVLKPKRTIVDILNFLDLPWNPMVLRHSEMVGKPDGISLSKLERSSDQVIKPINTQALYNWFPNFPADIFHMASELAPMLEKLNYSTTGSPYYGEADLMVKENDKWIQENQGIYEEKMQKFKRLPGT